MPTRVIIWIMISLLSCSAVQAQDPYCIHLDKQSGLPHDEVYDIFQDSKGFIWIAGNTGLCRYDGFEFKSYRLPGQYSKDGSYIQQDGQGRIWYSNFDGHIFYLSGDTLVAFPHMNYVTVNPVGIFRNHLLIPQPDGITGYDLRTFKVERKTAVNYETLSSCFKTGNHYYFLADTTLIFDSAGRKEASLNLNYNNDKLLTLTEDATGKIYFVQSQGKDIVIDRYVDGQVKKLYTIKDVETFYQIKIIEDEIWIGTDAGAYRMPVSGNGPVYSLFKKESINNILKDKAGHYWLSSIGNGIFLVPDVNRLYFTSEKITKIALIGNYLLAGNSKGDVDTINLQTHNKGFFTSVAEKRKIYQFYTDPDERDISNTGPGGIHKLAKLAGQMIYYVFRECKDLAYISNRYVAIASSNNGGLFLAHPEVSTPDAWDSLYCVNKINEQFLVRFSALYNGIRARSVAYMPADNTIYYAHRNGVCYISPNTKGEITDRGNPVLASKLITFNNLLYILSNDGTLLCYHPYTKEVTPVINQAETGLAKILNKTDKGLLIVTDEGVFLLNEADKILKIETNYNPQEIVDVTLWRDELLIAASGGVLITDLSEKQPTQTIPFYVKWIKINNQLQPNTEKLSVAYNQNDVEIGYAILDYTHASVSPWYYRVNEGDWKSLSTATRSLKLARLSPGDYIISFSHDKRTVQGMVKMSIASPWWLTWWFVTAMIISFLLGIVMVYRWRMRLQANENRLLIEKMELENDLRQSVLKSIKSQMNPHFLFNALNTIQSFIISEDKRNASGYLSKFSKLTRMILEMSEHEKVKLSEEINALRLYLDLEQMRFEDLHYKIDIALDVNPEQISIPSMIIQPYVENAIKHGLLHRKTGKELLVGFSRKADAHLQVTIEDNGIGRKKSAELNRIKAEKHQSFAIAANKKRVELLNSGNKGIGVNFTDKIDEDGNAAGTIVTIILKIE